MFKRDAWAVYTNSDLTEGKGYRVLVGYFTSRLDALAAGKRKGVMGTDLTEPYDIKIEKIKIYDSFQEWTNERKSDLRVKVLSRLTKEEKEALGLGEN